MSGTRRRLERLEALENPRERDEDAERRAWLATARVRRVHENRGPDEFHAGELLRLFRVQGKLDGATFEQARDMVLAWPTSPPPPAATERVLSRMVCEGEPGTENMGCPPVWREAWEAADELRGRHKAVPVETLAGWIVGSSTSTRRRAAGAGYRTWRELGNPTGSRTSSTGRPWGPTRGSRTRKRRRGACGRSWRGTTTANAPGKCSAT